MSVSRDPTQISQKLDTSHDNPKQLLIPVSSYIDLIFNGAMIILLNELNNFLKYWWVDRRSTHILKNKMKKYTKLCISHTCSSLLCRRKIQANDEGTLHLYHFFNNFHSFKVFLSNSNLILK